MTLPRKMLLIGCGNMGGAMLAGWLRGGVAPETFTVVDPYLETVADGVTLLREVPEGEFDAVQLAIKPQGLADAVPGIEPVMGPNTVLLSLLAGVEWETLAQRFPRAGGIVRIMPNLSAALGKSPIALAGEGLSDAQTAMVEALTAPLGQGEWIDEGHFDLVTALAGSGPAFVYRFIDALGAAATSLGLPEEQAQRLALATVEGASALAAQSDVSPGDLARRVASPGGTTQAGLDTLDANNRLLDLITDTLRAAARRGAEMAEEARRGG
ncbi:pyrroline-5-carboxylate reductase family protein [Croceicoccus naphthovorans]|uniref:Pyrroline-5-carboxylate reductase n=1 Tax=Croceicoccus naphthovorans TaxID=1348774 RepID=A0A0G3XGT9_9SPHN|nr:pyrroline-5-carboxylate reductase [Croceicoccus naphthovorans]AKM10750.1 pyrroline-5-carboxylate reductase [Croceicoccus naphthovorans]MBB3988938.1 pyrroline-5-carboxylate reductase [Croceicoccus naphthovorans]